jgi:hypothetical protein
MNKRSNIHNQQLDQLLDQLEEEFRSLLIPILKECAGGRWGLFGQNDHLDGSKDLCWSEAEQLRDSARESHTLRAEFRPPIPWLNVVLGVAGSVSHRTPSTVVKL